MTNKEYHKHSAVGKSQLSKISRSPLHYKFELENKKESTATLNFGSAAHKWILEKETFYEEFAILPSGLNLKTKADREIRDYFLEINEDKIAISADEFEQIKEMREAIDSHPIARKLLTGRVEQSFFWNDADTGIECKCRPDCINDDLKVLVDYKTTRDCSGTRFERDCIKFAYDLQAGMYTEGIFNNELEQYGFSFVVQESSKPYAVRVYNCDIGFIQQGYEKFRDYIEILHSCLVTGNWYGYETELNVETTLFGE